MTVLQLIDDQQSKIIKTGLIAPIIASLYLQLSSWVWWICLKASGSPPKEWLDTRLEK